MSAMSDAEIVRWIETASARELRWIVGFLAGSAGQETRYAVELLVRRQASRERRAAEAGQ